jgi:hypothetical protein
MRKRNNEQDTTHTATEKSCADITVQLESNPYVRNGRDTRLPPQSKLGSVEFQKRFIEKARTGLPIKTVCELMHCHETTFCDWQRKAVEGIEPFATFIHLVREARAADAEEMLELAKQQIEKKRDPKYALKYLDQLHRIANEKVTKKTIEHTGGIQVAPAFDVSKLNDEEFQQWCKLVEKMTPARKSEMTENQEPMLIPEFSSE